jgi:hypothetical protein
MPPSPNQSFTQPKPGCCGRLGDCLRSCWGYIVLPCYLFGNQTELERSRMTFALTANTVTGQRRNSYAAAAGDAIKAFEKADVDGSHTLDANELLKLEGVDNTASKRLQRLLHIFDSGFDDHDGMDLSHFKDLHYRMNKKCQAMMQEGESSAAKGELLMLYTVVDMLEERVVSLEKQLSAGKELEKAAQEVMANMDEIEKAARGTRSLMKKSQDRSRIQSNTAKSTKLKDMF